jgi:heat shock protein HslJ
MKKYTTILLFAIVCLSACKAKQNTTNQSITITDKTWVAVQLGEKVIEITEDRLPNLTLSEGKASGFGSCNRFHGTYTLDGNKILFPPLARTKMFCQEVQQIEDSFLDALSNAKSWEYKNTKLYFLGENKEVLVVFKMKE